MTADPRDDIYQVAALLAELDRVLSPLALEQRGELVSTPAMPPPLPPVAPRGAPPRSSGPAAPPRRMLGAAAPATSSGRTAPARATDATAPRSEPAIPAAPRIAPAPPRARRTGSAPPTREGATPPAIPPTELARPEHSSTAPGGDSLPVMQSDSSEHATSSDATRRSPGVAEQPTAAPARSRSIARPVPPQTAQRDRVQPPRRQTIAPTAAKSTPAAGAPPVIPRARPEEPLPSDDPRTRLESRDEPAVPRGASRWRPPAPPRALRVAAALASDRDATASAPARRATAVSPRSRVRTARSAGFAVTDHGVGSPARTAASHIARGSERPALPRPTRVTRSDSPRRLADPIAPPPLPRSLPFFERIPDHRAPLLDEPPAAPEVDPFDDEDDELATDARAQAAPQVTFWLRGGRVRVPVAAAAVARADRRLSRLARKRGRRL